MSRLWKGLIPVLAALAVWAVPTPQGLEPYAWQYFSIFVGVVVMLILEPIPAAAVGLVGVVLCSALMLVPAAPEPKPAAPKADAAKPADAPKPPDGVKAPEGAKPEAPKTDAAKPAAAPAAAAKVEAPKAVAPAAPAVGKPADAKPEAAASVAAKPADNATAKPDAAKSDAKPAVKKPKPADEIKWALAGFSNSTVWLIFIAFMFALGYEKTGLGKRISLLLIKKLGKRTLGLGYAVALADLALAPFMPSNTARSGGTIFPIIKNIPALYGSTPDHEPRKIGGYLMWVALATTCVTSTMFLTGLAPNLLALSLVEKTVGIKFAWMEWFMAFAPVGIGLFLAVPWLTYVLYPPTQKVSADAPIWAASELVKLGPITRKELTMAGLAVLALLGWIFAGDYLDATLVALLALTLMILTGVISWDDLLGHKQAWNVLFWFATLVTLADGLAKVGFLKWFATSAAAGMVGYSPTTVTVLLVVLFFVVHYLFASLTAHVTALLPVFLTTAAAIPGVNMRTLALLLCLSLGLMGIITPYATGPSPIYYGSGFVGRKDFWLQGFIFGAIFLAALVFIGIPYLMSMGG
ncbi:MAG TPA: DASS family sodium-coupled anion symporter [Humidesulfovibrio sp.]|uniref:DASS family sodium-coupled anion symporter n=1 Tax=Humidesulfovibrio sp. TaxID=2910988 RepID=UPI002C8A5BBC|nr:DASS family sodium-coupled anion symporter [Humidesulfovibrio sp.]HWR04367.1 DASS family sodium-coupled anion symporter [Humidesulfovibrio sp.]